MMCGDNAIPRVGGRHQAGHYTAIGGEIFTREFIPVIKANV